MGECVAAAEANAAGKNGRGGAGGEGRPGWEGRGVGHNLNDTPHHHHTHTLESDTAQHL